MSPRPPEDVASIIVREASLDARRLMSLGRWRAVDGRARLAMILGRAWPYILTRCPCASADELLALMTAIEEGARKHAGVTE